MSNENKSSIHDFDVEMICEYFSGLKRQGPGSPDTTRKAASFITGLNKNSRIADLGCGTGTQTLTLAEAVPGHITGLDLFPPFIEIMEQNIAEAGLQERITAVVGSMDDLPFNRGSLDLIWSEGAIYNIGFRRGINEWRDYLDIGGWLAVSEVSWFTDERPDEIADMWQQAYPEIDTIPAKVAQMQEAGYAPLAAFAIPDSDWKEHFYAPMRPVQEAFLAKYGDSEAARGFIENQRWEEDLYNRYCQYYGYVFYIGRKI